MNVLAMSALLCAMMVLTATAALESEELKEEEAQAEELEVEKRTHCSNGWTTIGHRSFLYVSKQLTYDEAEKNCVSLGGHLASVHSQWEYNKIRRLISRQSHGSPETWVGGSDSCQEGVWSWSDGSRFDFFKWCPGEPNNGLGTNQDCLQINYSGLKCWDDLWCDHHRPSVCVRNW